MKHKEVIQFGVKFLKKYGCSVILDEFVSSNQFENPDLLGFKASHSIVLEAKVSRADFRKDQNKFVRRKPEYALGNYRFYICPSGLIKPSELPEGFGLIYCSGIGYEVVVGPKSNWISPLDDEIKHFKSNLEGEKLMLISALRRVDKKNIKDCNYKVFIRECD